MADSNFRGPVNSMGSLEVDAQTAQVLPLDGPSMFYQNVAVPDIRSAPFAKDGFRPGQQPSFLTIPDFIAVDNFPQAASTTMLAAFQAITAGTAMSLATAQLNGPGAGIPSIAMGVPIMPQGTTSIAFVMALDFGFATGTTVAGSTTVVVNDNTLFTLGQWLVVGGAGNSAASRSLITQVQSIATTNTTGLTVSPAPATGLSHAPIGAANLFGGDMVTIGTQFGPQTASASVHSPNTVAGLARVHNPAEMISRNFSVTAGTTTATSTLTLLGYDVWRQPLSEQITIPSGNRSATTFFPNKAFKYLASATPNTTAGGSMSIGVGDVFGLPIRADRWEHTQMFWNGCAIPTSLGFRAASTVSPSTNTSGDVRGTIQVSTNGTGTAAAVATAAVSNGTARLTIIQNVGNWNNLFGTPVNTVPLFGLTNSTT